MNTEVKFTVNINGEHNYINVEGKETISVGDTVRFDGEYWKVGFIGTRVSMNRYYKGEASNIWGAYNDNVRFFAQDIASDRIKRVPGVLVSKDATKVMRELCTNTLHYIDEWEQKNGDREDIAKLRDNLSRLVTDIYSLNEFIPCIPDL